MNGYGVINPETYMILNWTKHKIMLMVLLSYGAGHQECLNWRNMGVFRDEYNPTGFEANVKDDDDDDDLLTYVWVCMWNVLIIIIISLHVFEFICEMCGCLWRPGPLKPELQVVVSWLLWLGSKSSKHFLLLSHLSISSVILFWKGQHIIKMCSTFD